MDNLLEHKVISQVISNLQEYFKQIEDIIKPKPQYKKQYHDLFIDYRELIGKQMWIEDENSKFADELVDQFLDFENDIKNFINKIKN